jgi:hypothetical protein
MSQRTPQSNKPFERQMNICMKLQKFDMSVPHGGAAIGEIVSPAWLQGQVVPIRMLDVQESKDSFRSGYDQKSNDQFFRRRASLQQFQDGYVVGRNHIDPMQAGGFIMFHGCTFDRELSTAEAPMWKAQYIENYGHEQDRAILQGAGRVSVREHEGATYANLDLLHVDDSQFVFSMSDVTRFYEENMKGIDADMGNEGAKLNATKYPLALVRIAYSNGSSKSGLAYTERVEQIVKDSEGQDLKIKVPGNHLDAMAAAFVSGKQGNGFFQMIGGALSDEVLKSVPEELQPMSLALRKDIDADRARIEMIPGARIPIVGKSLDDLMNEKHQLNRVAAKCWAKVEGRDGQPAQSVLGYIKMTVGVMTGKASIPGVAPNFIVTKFTEDEFAKARSANMLQTPLFNPVFTQQREHEANQRAQAAAQMGGVPHTDPEAGLDSQQSQEVEHVSEVDTMVPDR